MNPDPQPSNKPLYVPPRQTAPLRDRAGRPVESAHQLAAAEIARTQLENIYANDPNATMATAEEPAVAPTPVTATMTNPSADANATNPQHETQVRTEPLPSITRSFSPEKEQPHNPYQRTHDESQLHTDDAAWQQYHSAWQSYYQQYFHRYYAGHLQATNSKLAEQIDRVKELESRPVQQNQQTTDEALTDLRSQLRQKVKDTTKNVRKSRHFVPIVSACIVMAIFAFLQWNAVLFGAVAAYVQPASTDPSALIERPGSTVAPDENPRLIVPKIAVDVPIVWDVTPKYDSQMAAMKKGVAWFNIKGASARPGEVGNTVLSGHSSNDIFDDGAYPFVFARLDQVSKGDTVYINYEGTRYTYIITEKRVVMPNQVNALTTPVSKPIVTLITCTPLGTADKRLLVTAEQVSPNPNGAKETSHQSSDSDEMPGNAPSVLERMFGVN